MGSFPGSNLTFVMSLYTASDSLKFDRNNCITKFGDKVKSNYYIKSVLVTSAERRSEASGQSIDDIIAALCRSFLEARSQTFELQFDAKLGIPTLPISPNTTPVTNEDVQRMIEQFDDLDALHVYVLPTDIPVELDLDDELIQSLQKLPGFQNSISSSVISIAVESELPIEELIEAYRIEFQEIYGRYPA